MGEVAVNSSERVFALSDLMSASWLLAHVRMSSSDCCSSRTSSALEPWEMASDGPLRRWRSFSRPFNDERAGCFREQRSENGQCPQVHGVQRPQQQECRDARQYGEQWRFFSPVLLGSNPPTCQIYTRHPLPWWPSPSLLRSFRMSHRWCGRPQPRHCPIPPTEWPRG